MSTDSNVAIPALVIGAIVLSVVARAAPQRFRIAMRLFASVLLLICAFVAGPMWLKAGYAVLAVVSALLVGWEWKRERRQQ